MNNNKAFVRNAILIFKDSSNKVSDMEIKCGGDKVKNQNNQYIAKARVAFSIEKKFSILNHLGHILIYNLNTDSVKYILQNFDIVELKAGYNDNLGFIFSGFINEIFYKKENDYILEIYAISNFISKLKINISYTKDATNLRVLQKLNQILQDYNLIQINYSLADPNFLSSNFGSGNVSNYIISISDIISYFQSKCESNGNKYAVYLDDYLNNIIITSGDNYNPNGIIDLDEEINEYTARYWEVQNLLDKNYFNNIVYKFNPTQVILQNNNLLLSSLTDTIKKKQDFLENIRIVIKIDSRINIGTVLRYTINNKKYIFQVVHIIIEGDTHFITKNWNYVIYLKRLVNN